MLLPRLDTGDMSTALNTSLSLMPAAEYVRMSSSVQDQSIELQRRAIAAYASEHGLQVVRTYVDAGISGLTLKRRKGLQQLLQDVQRHDCGFTKILVYDVSRWGRFQQTDESAYYEFHCRIHGAEVIYIAEPFRNDSSLLGTLVKSMKRAMAGEYSRELAVKVRAGQEKVVRAGYSASHNPHLGFRRQVVSPDPKRCITLAPGERKAVSSDRIKVVLGPVAEQALVKKIFMMYVNTPISIKGIVKLLNAKGHVTPTESAFSESIVRTMLANELYVGVAVWGRESVSLGNRTAAHPDRIVRTPGGVPSIISSSIFEKARKRLALNERSEPRNREQLLAELRVAVKRYPLMSANAMSGRGFASREKYRQVFGSLTAAYELIGHAPPRKCGNHISRTYEFSGAYVAQIGHELMELGADVCFNRKVRVIRINNWFLGVLVVVPVKKMKRSIWPIVKSRLMDCDLLLILRVSSTGRCLDTYLVPSGLRDSFPGTLYGYDPVATQYRLSDLTQLALLRV